jgi:hypothetical protein
MEVVTFGMASRPYQVGFNPCGYKKQGENMYTRIASMIAAVAICMMIATPVTAQVVDTTARLTVYTVSSWCSPLQNGDCDLKHFKTQEDGSIRYDAPAREQRSASAPGTDHGARFILDTWNLQASGTSKVRMTYRTIEESRGMVEFTIDELSLGPIRLINDRRRENAEEEIVAAIFRIL